MLSSIFSSRNSMKNNPLVYNFVEYFKYLYVIKTEK